MKEIKLKGEYITLGQVLKLEGYVSTGGEAKLYLASNEVFVNGVLEQRRGRKLYVSDIVKIAATEYKII